MTRIGVWQCGQVERGKLRVSLPSGGVMPYSGKLAAHSARHSRSMILGKR
ncbi:Uncharacterised protein [Vibrio cholerae]|uniref:Uncharacterized protein n=1 Tax=Vibrio cholerae TaxID=666 RepID=A0A655ZFM2_VIBCL|nr:Uncharacterised protein [Vibrio cholerae]